MKEETPKSLTVNRFSDLSESEREARQDKISPGKLESLSQFQTASTAKMLEDLERIPSPDREKLRARIRHRFDKQMGEGQEVPRRPKRLLILECSSIKQQLGMLVVLADPRLNSSNTDIIKM